MNLRDAIAAIRARFRRPPRRLSVYRNALGECYVAYTVSEAHERWLGDNWYKPDRRLLLPIPWRRVPDDEELILHFEPGHARPYSGRVHVAMTADGMLFRITAHAEYWAHWAPNGYLTKTKTKETS